MDPARNMANYRSRVHLYVPPMLPIVAVHMKDIYFLHEAVPTYLENGLVNFDKFREVCGAPNLVGPLPRRSLLSCNPALPKIPWTRAATGAFWNNPRKHVSRPCGTQ